MPERQSQYYRIEESEEATVVSLLLPTDTDVAAFNEITADLVDRWPFPKGTRLVIDLESVHYIGSILLGLLINLRHKAKSTSGRLAVAAPSPNLLKTFRTASLERLIPVYPTVDSAVESI